METNMSAGSRSASGGKKKIVIIFIFGFILIVGLSIGWSLGQGGTGGGEKVAELNLENNDISQGVATQDEILDGNGFSVLIPKGWKEVVAPSGVSAMVLNAEEEITDPALQKLNFQSYYSVSYDTLKEKTMEEYVVYVKDMVKQFAPDIIFTSEESLKVNTNNAYKIEADLNQQGADFKVFIFLVKGKDSDIWNMSFNSGAVNWEKNKEEFNRIGGTFTIK